MKQMPWILGAGAAVVLALAGAGPAHAAPADVVDGGEPGLLTVVAEPLSINLSIDPGEHGDWLLAPHLEAETDGTLGLTVIADGELASDPAGLRIAIAECSIPWTTMPSGDADCAGTTTSVLTEAAIVFVTAPLDLGTLETGADRFFRVRLSLPVTMPNELQGASAEIRLGFAAAGDETIIDGGTHPQQDGGSDDAATPARGKEVPGGSLASSGVFLIAPLGIALVLGVVGAILTTVDRRRRLS